MPALSYVGLFVLSFLAATVLPLSSEASLAALVGLQGQLVAPVLVWPRPGTFQAPMRRTGSAAKRRKPC